MAKERPVKKKFDVDEVIQQQVIGLDAAIEAIDRRLAPFQNLINKRNQLLAARRALLNEGRMTGGTGTRVTLDEVYHFFQEDPGATTSQAAEKFGVALSTISSHIYRNKERFIKKGNGYYARDPEAGIDTADDIEEDDE